MRRFLALRSSKPLNSRSSGVRSRRGGGTSLTVASLLNSSRWSALPVVALLITACGGGSASSPQPAKRTSATVSKAKPSATKPPNDTEQLNKLLIMRASALQAGDVKSYADTATGPQIAKDTHAIQRAKGLPLNSVRLLARGTEIDGDKATMRVDMIYSLDSIDTEYVKTSRMSAQRTKDGW